MLFKEKIDPETLVSLPLVNFAGEIIVIDTNEAVIAAVEYLEKQTYIGFDTETRPSFTKGKRNSIALLQLSSQEKAFLFRTQKIDITPITSLLTNKTLKIGVAIRDDIKGLAKLAKFVPAGFVDLQHLVKKYGVQELSIRKMAAIVLNIHISKSQQLSNWENEVLTEAQMKYAATDAWVCREIFSKFLEVNSDIINNYLGYKFK